MIEQLKTIREALVHAERLEKSPGLSTGKVQFHATTAASNLRHALTQLEAMVEEQPVIYAKFETEDFGIIGSTDAPVKRVEHNDDGSYTVVIDYWPVAHQSLLAEAIDRINDMLQDDDGQAFKEARKFVDRVAQQPQAEAVPFTHVTAPVSPTPEILRALGNERDGANRATWQKVIEAIVQQKGANNE